MHACLFVVFVSCARKPDLFSLTLCSTFSISFNSGIKERALMANWTALAVKFVGLRMGRLASAAAIVSLASLAPLVTSPQLQRIV